VLVLRTRALLRNRFWKNRVLRWRYPSALLLVLLMRNYLTFRVWSTITVITSTLSNSQLTSSSIIFEDGGALWSENDWLGGLSISGGLIFSFILRKQRKGNRTEGYTIGKCKILLDFLKRMKVWTESHHKYINFNHSNLTYFQRKPHPITCDAWRI
jgi:hypothetical protein